MNREVKFRVWDQWDKQMHYSNNWMSDTPYFLQFAHLVEDIDVDNNLILMQYTGLKDKKGVEIYESDFVKVEIKNVVDQLPIITSGVVKYSECEYRIWLTKEEVDKYGILSYDMHHESDQYEVIGNRHENPELLEKGTNHEI